MTILFKIYKNQIIRYAYLGWLAIALFYCYQYILRVAPGVLIEDIRHAFKITAEEFSTLGFYYLLGYSLMQIPLGIIVDKIGVKKVSLSSILICMLGTYMFAHAEHFATVQISRLLIGIGSAGAFMCSLKFISDHIPPGNRGFLMGATLALGTIGAIISGKFVSYLDVKFSWREVVEVGLYAGVAVFAVIFLMVKSGKEDHTSLNQHDIKETFSEVLSICKRSHIILYALLAVGLYSPLSALADLWGVAFIMKKFALTKAEAAQYIMLTYIGLTAGSLIMPWYCEKYKFLNKAIVISSFTLVFCLLALIFVPTQSVTFLVCMLLAIGFFGGAEMMCFTGALIQSTSRDSGQIIGVVNTFNMLCGGIIQWLIGYYLDLQWSGDLDSAGVRVYSLVEFENALALLILIVLVCAIYSLNLMKKSFKYKI